MKFNIFLLCLLCLFGTGCSESREDKYIRVNAELARLESQRRSVNFDIDKFLYPDGERVLEIFLDETPTFSIDEKNAEQKAEQKAESEKKKAEWEQKRAAVEKRKTDPIYKDLVRQRDELEAQINEVKIIIIAMEKT